MENTTMSTGIFTKRDASLNPNAGTVRQKPVDDAGKVVYLPGAEIAIDESAMYKRMPLTPYSPDDVFTKKGIEVFRKMLNDPEIDHAVNALITIRKSSGWTIEHGEETSGGAELVQFLEFVFAQIDGSFDEDIKGFLRAISDGVSISEKIWKQQTGGKWNGKLILHSLKHKNPEYYNLETDDFDNLIAVRNISSIGYGESYDPSKFVVYSFDKQYENIWGRPRIRSLYDYWYLKQLWMRAWGIYLEKFGTPHVVIKRPANADETLKSELLNIVKKVRLETGFVIPEGIDYKVTETTGNAGDMYTRAIAFINTQIQKTVLGQTLTSEIGDAGSKAAASVHFDELLMYEDEIGNDVARKAINLQVIRPLIDINFGPQDKYPEFKFNSLQQQDVGLLVDKYNASVSAGTIQHRPEDENTIRRMLKMPEREITEEERAGAIKSLKVLKRDGTPMDKPAEQYYSEKIFTGTRRRTLTEYEDGTNFSEIKETVETEAEQATVRNTKVLEDIIDVIKKQIASRDIIGNKDFSYIKKLPGTIAVGDIKRIYADALKAAYRNGSREAKRYLVDKKRKLRKLSECRRFQEIDIRHVNPEEAIQLLDTMAFNIAGAQREQLLKIIQPRLIESINNGYTLAQTLDLIDQDLDGAIFNAGAVGEEFYTGAQVSTIANTYIADALNLGRDAFFKAPELEGYVEAYQYSAILDDRVRPNHAALDGLIYKDSDPIWASWVDTTGKKSKGIMPPNGWNCRCLVVPVTMDDGYELSKNPPRSGADFGGPDAKFKI